MKKLLLCGLAAVLTSLANHAARADMIGFTTTGGNSSNPGFYTQGRSLTLGYTFTLTQNVSVTQLGFFDDGNNGLQTATPITIWNGSGAALATATVPIGTGPEVNGYEYVTLAAPVTLMSGTYTIGAFDTSGNDRIQISTTPAGAAGITYGAARSGEGDAYPATDSFQAGTEGGAYFGPNFQFNNTAPEPSTWALLGVGVGGWGVVTLRRRRAGRVA